jgi:formamidopyrimidine-DNA glycosylase
MPELPEVETTRRGIEAYVTQQTLKELIIRQPQLRWPISPELNQLQGQVITELTRRGKYIVLHTSIGAALIHLGMSGSLRVVDSAQILRKHDHFDLVLSNGYRLRYHDPRRFGAFLWAGTEPLQHKLLCKLGVEPLSEDFTAHYLFAKSRGRLVSIKEFIMNANIVVGVGNIYASESLFLARIHPTQSAHDLDLLAYTRLVTAIKQVLNYAIECGGTTLRDFVNATGETGYFQLELNVYGRKGEACKLCHTPIHQMTQGQRSTWYCPQCQWLASFNARDACA